MVYGGKFGGFEMNQGLIKIAKRGFVPQIQASHMRNLTSCTQETQEEEITSPKKTRFLL